MWWFADPLARHAGPCGHRERRVDDGPDGMRGLPARLRLHRARPSASEAVGNARSPALIGRRRRGPSIEPAAKIPQPAEETMDQQQRPREYPVADTSAEASENLSQHVAQAAEAASHGEVGDAVQAGLDAVKDLAQTAGHLVEGN